MSFGRPAPPKSDRPHVRRHNGRPGAPTLLRVTAVEVLGVHGAGLLNGRPVPKPWRRPGNTLWAERYAERTGGTFRARPGALGRQ